MNRVPPRQVEYDDPMDEFYLCDLGSLNGTYMQMVSQSCCTNVLVRGCSLLLRLMGACVPPGRDLGQTLCAVDL